MSALIFGIGVTIACLALALGGLWLVRRKVGHESLKLNHEVAAVMISVLGTLYAVVLGMVVVDALAHREIAQAMESNEANALATILHLVRTLPVPVRKPIMQAELEYCELAIDEEWPTTLSHGTGAEKKTVQAYGKVWSETAGYEPKTSREQNIHASLLTCMTQLSDSRRYRIVTCKQGIPSLLWLVLITGGICTIGFTFFFGAENLKAQMIMTAIVTFMLCLNILLVFFYGRPYSGDLRIEPNNLTHVRNILRTSPVLMKPESQDAIDAKAKQLPDTTDSKAKAELNARAKTESDPAAKPERMPAASPETKPESTH
jgi:hypothetical protein